MSSVEEYLQNTSATQRAEFERLQNIVKGIVPDVEETISYGIPTFKYKGTYLLYFGAFKNHMSVFPGSYLIDDLQDQLKDYKIAKGTIQYTEDNLLPESVIKHLVQMRKTQIDQEKS